MNQNQSKLLSELNENLAKGQSTFILKTLQYCYPISVTANNSHNKWVKRKRNYFESNSSWQYLLKVYLLLNKKISLRFVKNYQSNTIGLLLICLELKAYIVKYRFLRL